MDVKIGTIISKHSTISQTALIKEGCVVLPSVYIGPGVIVGFNNFITTGSLINHDTIIGDNNYFSTGVMCAGRVSIGNDNRLDTGAIVLADAVIGNSDHIKPGIAYGPQRKA